MKESTEIRRLQPPEKLAEGFLKFAEEVNQKSIDLKTKFTEEEMADIFNNSFSGKIRTNFLFWINDLNKIISGINIILSDLSDLEKDKNSLKGNPISRSEFLFQAFFGEFFRIRETSKIYIKILTKEKVISNNGKKSFTEFYFTAFKKVYKIRNMFIHEGLSFKNYNIEFGKDFFEILTKTEQEKFLKLIKESNTRENTVEIQCAIYIKYIKTTMSEFLGFQDLLNDVLADLIIEYEENTIEITVANTV